MAKPCMLPRTELEETNPKLLPYLGMTTTTLGITTVGTTTTTSTRSHSTCDTVRGCRVNGGDWETTTRISCSTGIAKRGEVEANPTPTPEPLIRARDDENCKVLLEDIIIYPEDPHSLSEVLLSKLSLPVNPDQPAEGTWKDRWKKVEDVDQGGYYVAFIYIPEVPKATWEAWKGAKDTLGVSTRGTCHGIPGQDTNVVNTDQVHLSSRTAEHGGETAAQFLRTRQPANQLAAEDLVPGSETRRRCCSTRQQNNSVKRQSTRDISAYGLLGSLPYVDSTGKSCG